MTLQLTSCCIFGILNYFSQGIISWDLFIVWDDDSCVYVDTVIVWQSLGGLDKANTLRLALNLIKLLIGSLSKHLT